MSRTEKGRVIMTVSNRPPSNFSKLLRRAIVRFYRGRGWKVVGEVPKERKFVLVAAPHTSNWDFLYFIGLTEQLGFMPHFMAKDSLFRWPWKNFLYDMGGVSIDRGNNSNVVQQMVDEFNRRDEFMLTIAPEGTRSTVGKWKTGFYQIALAAKVPMIIGLMNYGTKTGGLGPAIMPTGDYEADMAKIKPFYDSVIPRHPERAVKNITGNGDA